MNSDIIYCLEGVEKRVVEENKQELVILKDINFKISRGESVAIVGPSGAGKTTLLNIMGGLDVPSKGKVWFCDKDLHKLSPYEKASIRNKLIGFVFQFYHLLPEFSVIENVAMPMIISGMYYSDAIKNAKDALKTVGLEDKSYQPVNILSGGEKQLVAIARAVVLDPLVILADEPTGNLDVQNAELISNMLLNFNKTKGTTLVVVTHNLELASKMNRRIKIYGGEIKTD